MDRDVLERFPVDIPRGEAFDHARYERLTRARPTHRAVLLREGEVTLASETPWYLAVVFVGCFALGILFAASITRTPYVRMKALLAFASGAHLLVAIGAIYQFLKNLYSSVSIVRDLDELVVVRRGMRARVIDRVRCDEVEDVCVRGVKYQTGGRDVVIRGPRHAVLVEVHREKWIDPPGLVHWFADAVAYCATRSADQDAC